MPPFNNKPPSSNRPSLKPMTQTLNVSRPVLTSSASGTNRPNFSSNESPVPSSRTPVRTPIVNTNGTIGKDSDTSKPKELRLSTGNVNNCLTPIIKAILAQYENEDSTVARTRQMLSADLSRQIPIGMWQVTSGGNSMRLSLTSFDRKTNIVYIYQ